MIDNDEIRRKIRHAYGLLGEVVAALGLADWRAQFHLVKEETEMTRKTVKEKYKGVRKHGSGFEGRFTYHGQQFSVTAETDKECYQRLADLKERVKRGLPIKVYTFAEWYAVWAAEYKDGIVTEKHRKTIDGYFRLHVSESLKQKELSLIMPLDLKRELKAVSRDRTRKGVYTLFHDMFARAEENKLITYNPMTGVSPVKYDPKEGKPLTKTERINFFEKIGSLSLAIRKMLLLIFCTGMRRAEAYNFNPKTDIDLTERIIYIRGTKTKGSFRYMPLTDEILSIFENDLESEYPFHEFSIGTPLKALQRIYPCHTLKDLRTTWGTMADEQGVSLSVIQHLMGHSTYKTTKKHYIKVLSERVEEELSNMQKVVCPKFAQNSEKKTDKTEE